MSPSLLRRMVMSRIKKAAPFGIGAGLTAPHTPYVRRVTSPSFARGQFSCGHRYLATVTETSPSIDRHQESVRAISESVRHFYGRKEKFRIFHGSTNSTRPSNHDRIVDTSALN